MDRQHCQRGQLRKKKDLINICSLNLFGKMEKVVSHF